MYYPPSPSFFCERAGITAFARREAGCGNNEKRGKRERGSRGLGGVDMDVEGKNPSGEGGQAGMMLGCLTALAAWLFLGHKTRLGDLDSFVSSASQPWLAWPAFCEVVCNCPAFCFYAKPRGNTTTPPPISIPISAPLQPRSFRVPIATLPDGLLPLLLHTACYLLRLIALTLQRGRKRWWWW